MFYKLFFMLNLAGLYLAIGEFRALTEVAESEQLYWGMSIVYGGNLGLFLALIYFNNELKRLRNWVNR
jgi:hypothetical protein